MLKEWDGVRNRKVREINSFLLFGNWLKIPSECYKSFMAVYSSNNFVIQSMRMKVGVKSAKNILKVQLRKGWVDGSL